MVECAVSRLRVTTLYAVICLEVFSLTSQTYSQPLVVEQETSFADITSFSSFSSLLSSDVPWTDRRPCVFRGGLRLHEQTWTLDPCTLCVCNNGTSDCDIVTCPIPKCDNPVKITGECCLLCPYKMQFFNIFNHFSPDARVTEGKRKKIKFSADVEVYKQKTSRRIRGENMWRISAWVSRNSDGSGQKFSYEPSVLAEDQSAQEFSKKDYNPPENKWVFKKLRYTFDGSEGTCDDFRYFCIKFNMTDDPRPAFDLDFSYTVYREEYERETHCVQLGQCEGVVAKTLDWGLIGQNPIPGQETPVSIDIDVTFRDDTRDLEGDGLWRVALFGSGNSLGEGPRFGEVVQILNDDESSTSIRGANPLEIDGIQTDFEYGSIGCFEDVNYICMEFLKGDAPNPDFTLTLEGVRGDVSRESMILCKEQECQSRVVFKELKATLRKSEILLENTDNTNTTVKLKATTDKLLTTTVSGEQLWQVKTFFSQSDDGRGKRINEQPQILTSIQDDQTLNTGENLIFNKIDFQADLSGMTCVEIPFMCFELMKNPSSSIDYTFETQPDQNPFVDCISIEDVCKGVVFNELEWFREIPEDHVPGTASLVVIDARVDVEPYSTEVTGKDLWEVSVFASRDELGHQRRDPFFADILTPIEAGTSLPQGGPLTFSGLETPPFDVDKMGCGEFRYLCLEFRKSDNPVPDFTFETKSGEDAIVTCHPEDCTGVFAETFDWELTGENPIPGEETPVSIDIDVTFRQDTRDLEGDDLWRVALFGSSNILGEGPRFGEVAQILNDDESSTDIRNANPLEIDGIQTDFEYGTIGCIEDVNYICMEFLKGDAPNPEFTLLVDGGRGDVARETMVLCKPQECQSRVVFTELEATLLNPEIIVENTDTDTTVKLKATTDKLLTTTVSGEQLWQVKTFFSQNDDGRGRRVNEQPQILTATQDDQTLNTGENLAFSEMDFQVDLSGLTCAEIPYMCFELMKNPLSSIDYTFETQPEQDPFVDCISMDDVCKGVVFTELEWSREVPEDHVPGTESSVVIDASVDVEPYSREVTGVDLWQVSVFASRDELGNERRDPIFADILTPIEAATTLPQGGPLTFPSLETPPFDVDKMGCGEFRYLCVEFRKGDNPVPDFTYETKSGEDTIVKCHAEDCAGMYSRLSTMGRNKTKDSGTCHPNITS